LQASEQDGGDAAIQDDLSNFHDGFLGLLVSNGTQVPAASRSRLDHLSPEPSPMRFVYRWNQNKALRQRHP